MRTRHSGFTLFETLVAMALMAMLLGALLPVFQGGMKSLQFGSRQTRAALLAQSILTRALVEQAGAQLVPPTVGVTDGMRWSVQRRAYRETELPGSDPDPAAAVDPQLWELSVAVEWSNENSITLKGLTSVPVDIASQIKADAS